MKNSLNNLNEIFSEFAILFPRQQKEVEVREGRRRKGERAGGRGWEKDPHFFLSANFSECQEVAWLKKNLFVIFTALGIISYGTSASSNFSVH